MAATSEVCVVGANTDRYDTFIFIYKYLYILLVQTCHHKHLWGLPAHCPSTDSLQQRIVPNVDLEQCKVWYDSSHWGRFTVSDLGPHKKDLQSCSVNIAIDLECLSSWGSGWHTLHVYSSHLSFLYDIYQGGCSFSDVCLFVSRIKENLLAWLQAGIEPRLLGLGSYCPIWHLCPSFNHHLLFFPRWNVNYNRFRSFNMSLKNIFKYAYHLFFSNSIWNPQSEMALPDLMYEYEFEQQQIFLT